MMKKFGLLLISLLILNSAFAMESNLNDALSDTLKPKEVRIEKKIINNEETTQIWVDGEELEVGSEAYKEQLKKLEPEHTGKKHGKRKIIIKEIDDLDAEFSGIDPDDIATMDVIKTEKGKKIIIKKKDGEVIEKMMDNGEKHKEVKVIVMETDDKEINIEDIDVDEIESINVEKMKQGKKVIIKKKNGEIMEETVINNKNNSKNVEVEVESTENGEKIIIKENGEIIEEIIVGKDGKQEVKVITENEETEVIIIKDENGKTKKRKQKSKSKKKDKSKKVRVIIKEEEEVEEVIIDNN